MGEIRGGFEQKFAAAGLALAVAIGGVACSGGGRQSPQEACAIKVASTGDPQIAARELVGALNKCYRTVPPSDRAHDLTHPPYVVGIAFKTHDDGPYVAIQARSTRVLPGGGLDPLGVVEADVTVQPTPGKPSLRLQVNEKDAGGKEWQTGWVPAVGSSISTDGGVAYVNSKQVSGDGHEIGAEITGDMLAVAQTPPGGELAPVKPPHVG